MAFLPIVCGAHDLPATAAIDAKVRSIMVRTHAKGLAIAIIDNGQPGYVQAYGVRNDKGDPPHRRLPIQAAAGIWRQGDREALCGLVRTGSALAKADSAHFPDAQRRIRQFRLPLAGRQTEIPLRSGSRYAYSGDGLNTLQFVMEAGRAGEQHWRQLEGACDDKRSVKTIDRPKKTADF